MLRAVPSVVKPLRRVRPRGTIGAMKARSCRVAPVVCAIACACSFQSAAVNGTGDGGGGSVDVIDVEIDAPPGVPDGGPDSSTPCVTECLSANELHDCEAGNDVPCPAGCLDTPEPHCATVIVSNDPDAQTHLVGVPATADLVVTAGSPISAEVEKWDIWTDTGEIVDGTMDPAVTVREPGVGVDDAGGQTSSGIAYYQTPTIGIFVVDSMTIQDGALLYAYGGRALLILSRGDVDVHGLIDAAAGVCSDGTTQFESCPGPGGGEGGFGNAAAVGCSMDAAGGPGQAVAGGAANESGGGGGALVEGADGEAGGDTVPGAPDDGGRAGTAASPPCPDETGIPLVGGSGGGVGGFGGAGGGGGGAIQITSFTQIHFVTQTAGTPVGIHVGGNGGAGGGAENGGGGGGSGGLILVEAPDVRLDLGALVAANGGGGGSGNATSAGQSGGFDTISAIGGLMGRAGGSGGSRAAGPTAGIGPGDGTGGGGGAAGLVRINATTIVGATTQSSPMASTGPLNVE
jgi:hypothetical protein